MFELAVTTSFEASHLVDASGAPESYRRVHGHSFVVTAVVAAEEPGPEGWVMDLGALEAALQEAVAPLDHSLLNDIPGLERPTFERLLPWIDARLRALGVSASRIDVERPTLRQKASYSPGR